MKKFLLLLVIFAIFSCSKEETPEPPKTYQLSTTVSPSEGGTITGVKKNYKEGEEAKITAVPAEDFDFVEWQGDVSGTENPITIGMGSDQNITALFEKKTYSLSFDIIGKWYFQNPNTNSTSANKNYNKQSDSSNCSVHSIEFKEDGTYVLITENNEYDGQFVIIGNKSIDLGIGKLENIQFVNDVLSFALTLNSGCSSDVTALLLTYVPDDAFEQELIRLGYDDVLDNFVSTKNIETIKDLSLSPSGSIGALTGIESFKELEVLSLYNGYDYSNYTPGSGFLDITKNLELRELVLASYALQSLDVSKNQKLEKIILDTNGLESSIDFSKNIYLKEVYIIYQYNTGAYPLDFDFRNNPSLEKLGFEDIYLNSVDITENKNLISFYVTEEIRELKTNGVYENLISMEISGSSPYRGSNIILNNFPNLESFFIHYYRETIDLSNNLQLKYLHLMGAENLKSLDLSHNTVLNSFTIHTYYGQNFECIKVNAEQLEKLESQEYNWTSSYTYSLNCP